MRNDLVQDTVKIRSLPELDALVGTYLTGETPETHWEDSHTQFQFHSFEEAIDSLEDPFFRQFSSNEESRPTVLTEVKRYRRYSSDLTVAWDAVEQLSANGEPFQVRREKCGWVAAFGQSPAVEARSAPMAICLAALRAKGIDVELDVDRLNE